jgi:hypothetical protein
MARSHPMTASVGTWVERVHQMARIELSPGSDETPKPPFENVA